MVSPRCRNPGCLPVSARDVHAASVPFAVVALSNEVDPENIELSGPHEMTDEAGIADIVHKGHDLADRSCLSRCRLYPPIHGPRGKDGL
jgi:hypothetical protein